MSSEQQQAASSSAAAAPATEQEKKPFQRMKVAIIFGYVGYGYYGLQYNFDPVRRTIEAELVDALHAVGYISDENMLGQFLKKICWERASRTDKGVSALRNVVNAKLQLPRDQNEEEWIAPLNEILKPKKMQVFRIIHTCSSFDCYLACTGRKYEYLLPTYALLPPPLSQAQQKEHEENGTSFAEEKLSQEIRELLLASTTSTTTSNNNGNDDNENNNNNNRRRQRDDPTVDPTDVPQNVYFEKMLNYRVSTETIHKFRGFFTVMEGTNSFHNFTPQVTADDACATRFIRSITVSDPFIIPIELNVNGDENNKQTFQVEWVRIRLDGQSFMLNQIRKMIGGAIEVINRGGDAGTVRLMLSKSVRRIMPMAPANGLFLATMSLDKYNHKVERIKEQGQTNADKKQLILIPDVAPDDEMRTLVEKCIGEHECREEITARWVVGLMRTNDEDWVPTVNTASDVAVAGATESSSSTTNVTTDAAVEEVKQN